MSVTPQDPRARYQVPGYALSPFARDCEAKAHAVQSARLEVARALRAEAGRLADKEPHAVTNADIKAAYDHLGRAWFIAVFEDALSRIKSECVTVSRVEPERGDLADKPKSRPHPAMLFGDGR